MLLLWLNMRMLLLLFILALVVESLPKHANLVNTMPATNTNGFDASVV